MTTQIDRARQDCEDLETLRMRYERQVRQHQQNMDFFPDDSEAYREERRQLRRAKKSLAETIEQLNQAYTRLEWYEQQAEDMGAQAERARQLLGRNDQ